ncbi:MAG: glutamine synthetase family protein [Rhodospirillaceae bacterium]|nr:glutamine synthetase family protein [Rhodospirillaceae bacterium]
MDLKAINALIEKHGIRTVILAATDPGGMLRGKRLTVPYFRDAAEDGINFASFILYTTMIDDVLPHLFPTGIPDVKGEPDLGSFRIAGWEKNAAVVNMDLRQPNGGMTALCPRTELKRQIERARKLGYEVKCSLELEFFLLPTKPEEIRAGNWGMPRLVSQDIHCYSVYEGHFWESIVGALRDAFPDEIEGCAPEWGQGQFEANLRAMDPLRMADTTVWFKTAVKQLAAQAGMTASFMAKIHENFSGNSGHIHMSLTDTKTGKPAFWDESDPMRMSAPFRQFVAGQLDTFHETTMFYAPTVNAYKRFQSNSFAGVTRNWGVDNRTVGYRVINESAKKARLECRIGGADLNPYTALATMLGAGLRGIEKKLTPPAPGEGNCYETPGAESVPMTLDAALAVARDSAAIREVLNPEFVDNLIRIGDFETGIFRAQVTDLERRRYLEMA